MGTLVEKCTIKIGGKEYKDYNFMDISMTQRLLNPAELRFTMQKKTLKDTIKDSDFPLPKELMGENVECIINTIRFNEGDTQVNESLEFKGYVFNVEVYRSSDLFSEQLIDVQAISPDYLLLDHPHCFSYEDKNLKDIVTKTLDPYSIPNEIKPRTKDPIPYTVQYNESNYQFLTRLAHRYGEWMYNDGVKWIFGELPEKPTIRLEPRNDILNYRYKALLNHHKVKHAHHNYLEYENQLKSDADFPDLTQPGYHELTDAAKKKSDSLFGKYTFQHLRCSNPEVNSIDELEISVKSQLFGEKTRQVVCMGSSICSQLTVGSVIEICDHFYDDDKKHKNIDHDELIITSISHSAQVDGYYTNSFTAYPASSKYPPYYQSDIYPFSAPHRAKVMDNKDPKQLGRVRVQFLWQEEQDPNLMTPWIRMTQPYGGDDKGFYFIPEIGEEVMVDFENSNAEKPYVVGTLWHGIHLPRSNWRNFTETNDVKGIRTRNGHGLVFYDNHDNVGFVLLYDKESNRIALDGDKLKIHLESRGNIEMYADKDIIMEAGNNIIQKAGCNRISTIAEADNVSSGSHYYHADGAIHIEGKTYFAQGEDQAVLNSPSLVQIQSDSTANVIGDGSVFVASGGPLEVNAESTMLIKANATMDIKAGAPMTLDAPVVNIN